MAQTIDWLFKRFLHEIPWHENEWTMLILDGLLIIGILYASQSIYVFVIHCEMPVVRRFVDDDEDDEMPCHQQLQVYSQLFCIRFNYKMLKTCNDAMIHIAMMLPKLHCATA